MYSRTPVSSDGKFPPTPSRTYVNLTVVESASQISDLEELRKNISHGRVDEMLIGRKKIGIDEVLKPQINGNPVSLVFVEGPPGIGKSTLAWELCRRWDRKQYDLAVLLRLREKEVQQIKNLDDLFPHFDPHLQQSVTKEVLGREGKRVLFILDGYDELPLHLRHHGLFSRLLMGKIFPMCSVLVTSRASATRDLYRVCKPPIQRHAKILGFTQEGIKDYGVSCFSGKREVLENFLACISPSVNPIINSLMYIPLNAAIVVQIYRSNQSLGISMPKTLTEIYTALCLTLLQRYLDNEEPKNTLPITEFSDLPKSYCAHFNALSQLAFEQFVQDQEVFYSDSFSDKLVHFGFLDCVPALYGGGGVSYNFLSVTLLEFFAAYHISQLSNGIDVFNSYCNNERWEVVWRFVSGLTKFRFFRDSVIGCDAFASVRGEDLEVKNLLLHCLVEGQVPINFQEYWERSSVYSYQPFMSPSDIYVLGYCIANCASLTSWHVHMSMWGHSDETFLSGLCSNYSGSGSISCLEMYNVHLASLGSYPASILLDIKEFKISMDNDDSLHLLVQVIPMMRNLSVLSVGTPHLLASVIFHQLFDVLSRSNVTTLSLKYVNNPKSTNKILLFSLCNLINSPPHTLKELRIEPFSLSPHGDSDGTTEQSLSRPLDINIGTKPLCDGLFGPSSLKQLTLELPVFSDNSFDLLEANTCLADVHIVSKGTLPLQPLLRILHSNKTIENLRWVKCADLNSEEVQTINMALSANTTLKQLTLVTSHTSSAIELDPRMKLIYAEEGRDDSL